MEIAMKDGQILMRNLDTHQYTAIRQISKAKWDKKVHMMIAPADLDVLNTLNELIKLPPRINGERIRLSNIQKAIDHERGNKEPEPLAHFPVKAKLFKHQIRAVNMTLLAFEIVGGKNDKI